MKLNIYTKDGWIDFEAINAFCDAHGIYFVYGIGGRGIGKSYSLLKEFTVKDYKYIYMRRRPDELETITDESLSPFTALQLDKINAPTPERIGKNQFELNIEEKFVGLGLALSTAYKIRGFSAPWCEHIFFDEFIPEPHVPQIKQEARAIKNFYETVERNREFIGGKAPVRLWCMSNSELLANPIFIEENLVEPYLKIKKQNKEYYLNEERHLLLIDFYKSPVKAKKANTVLYEFSKDEDFIKTNLGNDFTREHFTKKKNVNLKEYKILSAFKGLFIYKHKSDNKYYICTHRQGTPVEYEDSEKGLKKFKLDNLVLYYAYLDNRVLFENVSCETIYKALYKMY